MLPVPFPTKGETYPGHYGLDFMLPVGTWVPASAAGVVIGKGYQNSPGYFIDVRYGNTVVSYCHLLRNDTVKVGQSLAYGELFALSGNSGVSGAPHLHMEVAGDATTAGFFRHFDITQVVGSTEGEAEEMIINVAGKAGVQHAHAYYVSGNQATVLAVGAHIKGAISLTYEQGRALAKRVSGIK